MLNSELLCLQYKPGLFPCSKRYAVECFEITTRSKSVSFIPHPYYPAEICIFSDSKRCLVCHMTKMKEEQLFLKYIPSTYCMQANFLICFIQKTIKGWRIKNKSFTI